MRHIYGLRHAELQGSNKSGFKELRAGNAPPPFNRPCANLQPNEFHARLRDEPHSSACKVFSSKSKSCMRFPQRLVDFFDFQPQRSGLTYKEARYTVH